MSISEKVQKDMTEAMRARDERRLSALRMVKAALKNREIEKRARCELFGRRLVPKPQHVYLELSACSNASS